jgi:hypothetical protein
MSNSSRRNFLKTATILGGGFAAFGAAMPKSLFAGTSSQGLPYYKAGAPFEHDLRRGMGESFTLQGIVYSYDGKTPLADAVVEIWHCNGEGYFDFSNQYSYRGKTLTDKYGKYRFKTHFPGKYEEHGYYKMNRIFLLVNGRQHQKSFSQLYFDHNKFPYIDNKHWSTCPMADRPSLPKRSLLKNQVVITYDHYLNGFAFSQISDSKEMADSQLRIYPNHLQQQTILTFGKFQPGKVSVRVLNKKGQLVQRHFFKNVKPFEPLAISHHDLPPGVYTYSVFSSRYGDFTRVQRLG